MNKIIKTIKNTAYIFVIFIKWILWMIKDLYEYIKDLFKIEIR